MLPRCSEKSTLTNNFQMYDAFCLVRSTCSKRGDKINDTFLFYSQLVAILCGREQHRCYHAAARRPF